MHVLLVGGLGYIGRHVAWALATQGHKITTFDRKFPQLNALLPGERFIYGDIVAGLSQHLGDMEGIDVVVHLAAMIDAPQSVRLPGPYYRVNFTGTLNVAEAAKQIGAKGIVFASSAAVYGKESVSPHREDAPILNPENPYGGSKLFGERVIRDVCGPYMNTVNFRFFNVVGSSMWVKAVPSNMGLFSRIVCSILHGDQVSVFGNDHDTEDGYAVRDYVSVIDIADAIALACEKINESKPLQQQPFSLTYNLGSGTGYSVKEVLDTAQEFFSVPAAVLKPKRPGEVSHSIASVDKIRDDWGWVAMHSVDILEALKQEHDARQSVL